MSIPSSKLRIALIGSHSGAFAKALRSSEILHLDQHDTLADVLKVNGAPPSAVILSGDTHLMNTHINQILEKKTVIALFRPSRSQLEKIHEATSTPVDIPRLKLHPETPLLIYMVGNVVHIAPNNIHDITEVSKAVKAFKGKSQEVGEKTQSMHLLDPAEHSMRSIVRASLATQSVRAYSSSLSPPPNVIGFKQCTLDHSHHISIKNLAWDKGGNVNVTTTDDKLIQRYDLNWYTDIYAYATGADCRGKSTSEFTNDKGKVYTITIERGNMQRAPGSPERYLGPTKGYCAYYFNDWNRTGTHSSSSGLSLITHQPSGEDSSSGTKHNYSIDFSQDMQMFSDNGNSLTTVKATYSDSFSLDKFQLRAVQGSAGVDYSVDYDDYYDHWADPSFSTSNWWDTGVYEKVDREGWEHWVVRTLPDDNLPIHGLTLFSSSVGKYSLTSKWKTEFTAFKSSAWKASNEGDTAHMCVRWSTWSGSCTWSLDLTWAGSD